ncbi:MAG: hypothetical protein AAGG53_02420 [Cyanobacteria bacterium P01_H01_bin.152]
MAQSIRAEEQNRVFANSHTFEIHKDTSHSNLTVEQHYQREAGRQFEKAFKDTENLNKSLERTANKETEIAICQKVLTERGTDKDTIQKLSQAVTQKGVSAVREPDQEKFGKTVVREAQERMKPQDQRQSRENTKSQTASHDASYMQSIQMMRDRSR